MFMFSTFATILKCVINISLKNDFIKTATTIFKTTTIYLLTSLKITNTIAIAVLLLSEGNQN